MNSLMGNGETTILPASEEEDLFGGIPVVSTSTDASNPVTTSIDTTIAPTDPQPQVVLPTPTSTTSASSLLATSGLLVSDGGGLFDEIDKEAEAAAAAAEAEQRAKEAAEIASQKAFVAAQEEAQSAAAAAQAAQEEAERLRRQQVQDQMQSIHLGGPIPPQNMPYGGGGGMQQLPQQQQPFYNNGGYPQQQQHQQFPPQQQTQYNMYPPPQQYPPPPPQTYPPQQYQSNAPQQQDMNSTVNHIPGAASYHDPNNMQQPNQSNSRYYQPSMIGSPTAGMYNGVTSRNNNHMQPQPNMQPMHNPQAIMQPTRPMAVAPGFYTRILVTEPLLLQSSPGGLFGIGQPPHWSYQITTELNPNVQQQSGQGGHQGVWMVRRRFRHVVALEDRLRDDCPGAILPPR